MGHVNKWTRRGLLQDAGRLVLASLGLRFFSFAEQARAQFVSAAFKLQRVFCAMGSGNSETSTDGVNWQVGASTPTGTRIDLPWVAMASNGTNLCALATWSSSAATSTDGVNWTLRALPVEQLWQALAWGGGKFVAIPQYGTEGAISTDNGATWSAITLPVDSNWQSVSYNGTVFCAVSSINSVAITSSDGVTWTQQTLVPGNVYANWTSIVWNGTIFCAVAPNTKSAATSSDGINWTLRTLPQIQDWRGLAWNGSVFCTLGFNSTVALTSPDGITWTARTLPLSSGWSNVTWTGTQFCAVSGGYDPNSANTTSNSDALTSADGITWTQRSLPSAQAWQALASNGSVIVTLAFDTNIYAKSTDGITWTQGTLPVTAGWSTAVWANSIFVAVGISTSNSLSSPDGTTWTARTLPNSGNWYGLAWNGSKFCTVANYSAPASSATSADGITWTAGNAPNFGYYCLAASSSIWVSMAGDANFFQNPYTSTDGINWTKRSIGLCSGNGSWKQICCLGSLFCAVGGQTNSAITSPDGVTWTARTLPGNYFWRSVASSGTTLCAISDDGFAATSPDGVTWTSRTVPSDTYLLAYGNSRFCAVGSGTAIVSTNSGVSWNSYAMSDVTSSWTSLAYGGGGFNCCGWSTNHVCTSPDGSAWTTNAFPAPLTASMISWLDPAWNGSRWVSVSDSTSPLAAYSVNGLTWTPTTPPTPPTHWDTLLCNGPLFLLAQWGNTSAYTSPDGVHWTATTLPVATWIGTINKHGKFILYSTTNLYTSSDGVSWASVALPSGDTWQVMVWNGSLYCLIGSAKVVKTSPDGVTWTTRTSLPVAPAFLATLGARFITFSNGTATTYTSSDNCVTWQASSFPAGGYYGFSCFSSNGSILLVNDYIDGLYSTKDGITWTELNSSTSLQIFGLVSS